MNDGDSDRRVDEVQQDSPLTLGDWLRLRDEMHAAELLLEDVQIAPTSLATYWAMSADLLALLQEIDDYLKRRQDAGPGDDESALYLGLRRRLVALLAKAEEVSVTSCE